MNKRTVAKVFKELRANGYGSDTWPAFQTARLIAESIFGHGKMTLIEQYITLESARKRGDFKQLTGNDRMYKKGGHHRFRAHRPPPPPQEVIEAINKELPAFPSERTSWFRTESFSRLCRQLHEYHPGQILQWSITIAKRYRRDKLGVYFARDPLRPNDYNVGNTSRSFESRFADAGSKGRYWEKIAELAHVAENEIHRVLKPWHDEDMSKRGCEIFILDQAARDLMCTNYGITLI